MSNYEQYISQLKIILKNLDLSTFQYEEYIIACLARKFYLVCPLSFGAKCPSYESRSDYTGNREICTNCIFAYFSYEMNKWLCNIKQERINETMDEIAALFGQIKEIAPKQSSILIKTKGTLLEFIKKNSS